MFKKGEFNAQVALANRATNTTDANETEHKNLALEINDEIFRVI